MKHQSHMTSKKSSEVMAFEESLAMMMAFRIKPNKLIS
jgi:hypothetical protein